MDGSCTASSIASATARPTSSSSRRSWSRSSRPWCRPRESTWSATTGSSVRARASGIVSCRAAGPRKSIGVSRLPQLRLLRALLRSQGPKASRELRRRRSRTRSGGIPDERPSHRRVREDPRSSPLRVTAFPRRMGRRPVPGASPGPICCGACSRSTSSSARAAGVACGCSQRSTRRTQRSPSSAVWICRPAPHRWPPPSLTAPRAASGGRRISTTPALEPKTPNGGQRRPGRGAGFRIPSFSVEVRSGIDPTRAGAAGAARRPLESPAYGLGSPGQWS